MKQLKILNLYSGIGGNRKLWGDDHDITAVEINQDIAKIYSDFFPDDKVIVGDAHQYLLEHIQDDWDFIWSSPPCQSHSRMIRGGRNRKLRYPDMKLYEEIVFLNYEFKGKWVVENVKPFYKPFMKPVEIGRHLIWSNFHITPKDVKQPKGFIQRCTVDGADSLKEWLGLNYQGNLYYDGNNDPAQVLRNCIHPELGLHILKCSQEKELELKLSVSKGEPK